MTREKTMERNIDITIRPYTHKELCALYGVSWRTLQHWLKVHQAKIGLKIGHFYTTYQVERIFECCGHPKVLTSGHAGSAQRPRD